MLRKFFISWTAISMLLAAEVQGQLPNLPSSLPKPSANAGLSPGLDTTRTPPSPLNPSATSSASANASLLMATPKMATPKVTPGSTPPNRAGNQPPVPTALSGAKTGQSETAVSVGTISPAASNISSNPSDGSKAVATSAVGIETNIDSKPLANLAASKPGPVPTNQDTKLTANGRRDSAPRPNPIVAANESKNAERASFKTMGPTIQVETIGPRSIAINKPAEFEIRVTNSGSTEARGITVEANFPAFVDLMSARPSAGGFDQQNQQGQPRLKWRIENLAPGSSESATLQVIPRSPLLFDFQVQWSADPLRGQAAVQVTEPKLDMRIAGPAEVQYGETAIYTVTIRNPGTGTAENVEIMLSEDLGGQRAAVGNIQPGEERNFEVELIPGDAGTLSLEAFAKADALEHSAKKEIIVRRADLEITLDGPPAVYAGTTCVYRVKIKNIGDALAQEVIAAAVLPSGAKYLGGIETAEIVNSGLRWNLGNMPIGEERSYEIQCSYSQAGDLRFETGVRAADDLAATHSIQTQVAALADVVLSVESPKGPLPIQEQVTYLLKVKNRGTTAGKKLQVAMQFSEGIEPVGATGASFDIEPGQITFHPIESLEVDQEITIRVQAIASTDGNHRFRAVLTCDDPVCEEIAQGTTRFYGNEIISAGRPAGQRSAEADAGLRR